jgi:trans-aconitate methyltransferase
MRWDSSLYDDKHAFVTKYGEGVLELLAPQAGERILDVGCGTGHLTKKIAASGAEVVGLDSSAEMIETARTAYPEIEFVVADAAVSKKASTRSFLTPRCTGFTRPNRP